MSGARQVMMRMQQVSTSAAARHTRLWTAIGLCVVAFPHATLAQSPLAQMGPARREALTDRERAIHLLNRTTYGARPADIAEVMRMGRAAWLDRQMRPASIPDREVEQRMALREGASAQQVLTTDASGANAMTVAVSPAVTTAGSTPAPPMIVAVDSTLTMKLAAARRTAPPIGNLATGKLDRAVFSERQLEEVMTDFWFNHFNVSYNKSTEIRYLVPDYEERAIRAHVFGKFEDMLAATAEHAAMMIYLDNARSVAPGSPAALAAERGSPTGLNENYARELMELHTLGVDAGYTQQDVIEVARAFTGWGFRTVGEAAGAASGPPSAMSQVDGFYFRANRHDTGDKIVLGRTIKGDRGMEEGREILDLLAHQPATAMHIATKLVRHFVSDEPDPRLVSEIAKVFADTDGDLRAVTRALFLSDRFYAPESYRAKAKRPFEFIASALRVSGASVPVVQQNTAAVTQLRSLRHLPYTYEAPTGFPTTADEWVSAGALIGRMNFSLELSRGRFGGIRFDPIGTFGTLAEPFLAGAPSADAMTAFLGQIIPGASLGGLTSTVSRDLAAQTDGGPVALMSRALGLAIGSPDFQRY
jgi:uncharacterized protein (DUF1800 family)